MRRRHRELDIAFEEAAADQWAKGMEVVEVPLSNKPLLYLALALGLVAVIVAARVVSLGIARGEYYEARATANANQLTETPAPRGLIVDRNGVVLADNRPVFSVFLDLREFLRNEHLQATTLQIVQSMLGVPAEQIRTQLSSVEEEVSDLIVLGEDVPRDTAVQLKALNLPTILVVDSFQRQYPKGAAFATILGYTSLASPKDLERNPELSGRDLVGKIGLEAFYDKELRGEPGVAVKLRDAKGQVIEEQIKSPPHIGETLELSIDAEFQEYFYERMRAGLGSLGRTSGVGLAMDPRTGEVLALLSFPAYDNNVFVTPGHSQERQQLLTSSEKPLFNRAISGAYSPGSTIKVLHALAVLKENIISTTREIFSPGYLDVPNPYNPDKPTRFLDWRYQGNVNVYSAIAQSSDVYFYEVIGGAPGITGLGITRLRQWWEKFNFGDLTGIDLPGETKGFLPSPDWKQKTQGRPWLLGDTYNVSIGQGDLQLTPIQLLDYISTIANGGTLYRPRLAKEAQGSTVIADMTDLASHIAETQKGMRLTVTSPQGTAYLLHDLPFPVAGKTGTAQINNNTKENSFFVGYAPANDPQIAILLLVENAKSGVLNTVPIARDVLNRYYEMRIK